MKRLASLDLLRGVAALAVAIPHYVMLGSTDWPAANVISILAVEIFFVLSGFVLAPQLLFCVESVRRSDIWTFLVRRWMRTIPPYLVALIAITLVSGNLAASSFPQYLFYVQNLFRPLTDQQDYFAVAWSLSVEECFYVVVAAIVLVANMFRASRKQFIVSIALFAVAIIALRTLAGDNAHWDAQVRRVTIFRLDAIAFGFLLYCAIDRLDAWFAKTGRWFAVGAAALTFAAAFICGWQATVHSSTAAQHAYPFIAALLGAGTITALYVFRAAFNGAKSFAPVCFFLGKVSYTIYLFHMLAILLLRPQIGHLPLVVQLVIYVALLIAFCAVFFFSFEAPILAARPHYKRRALEEAAPARQAMLARMKERGSLAGFAGTLAVIAGSAVLTRYFFFNAWQWPFYGSVLVLILGLAALLILLRLWRFGGVRTAALALFVFVLALPVADYLFTRTSIGAVLTGATPVYSFRDAKGDPDAFRMWWAQYVAEWGRGVLAKIQGPDPQGQLPFILIPNSRGKFFDADVPINNLGFRGADTTVDKNGRYRIFIVGESPVFGTMFRAGETTWPEALQGLFDKSLRCDRKIEVINAGVPAAGLSDNLVRIERFMLPLKPDMLVSYHGYNGLAVVDPQIDLMPRAPVYHKRGSPLLGEASFRVAMQAYTKRLEAYNADKKPTVFSDTADKLYSQLVALGQKNGIKVVLANLSAVVTQSSPQEVIDFYGRVFQPIERLLPAIAEQNRIVENVAKRTGTPFVDTRPGLDGKWDDDLFVDIVHFTQKGSNRIAKTMFDKLSSELAHEPTMNCRPAE
ncbi:acyltransferase family protein [Roseiarcaceae bacterium H3SJ34-1]|uniref:acyltransferase family protein n=1 Tax=Terripilifer ovatus TaxID=3032367 RepID=UPI003AB95E21|nr:acyltransferase family protein [Roseiarcaceae bacterium H3SJ34-1]